MSARGTFVDYCISPGEYRPALVVREFPGSPCVQLQVFVDKVNDGPDPYGADWFRSSTMPGEGPGTWRSLPSAWVTFTPPAPGNAAPFAAQPFQPFVIQQRCTCLDQWIGGTAKPPCPVHGSSTLIGFNATAAAAPQ